MKGLLRKELYLLMSGTGLLFAAASLLFAFSGGISHERNTMQAFAFVYVPLGAYSLLSMEEKWRWPNFLKCAPVTLKQMVGAKYIVTGAQMAVNALIFGGLNLIFCDGESLGWMLGMLGIGLISAAIVYPLIFWQGPEKGWIGALFCFLMLGAVGISLMSEYWDTSITVVSWLLAHSWALTAAGVVLYILSCPLSAKLYRLRK